MPDEHVGNFVATYGSVSEWLGVESGTDDLIGRANESDEDFTGDDFLTEAKRRQGQGIFSGRVKANYGNACAICGISEARFLVAGHIIGWAEDRSQRLNPANGICLCIFHDRAFEAGFITLDARLQIVVSPRVVPDSPLGQQLCSLAGAALRLPTQEPPAEKFLAAHRIRLLI